MIFHGCFAPSVFEWVVVKPILNQKVRRGKQLFYE